VLEIRFEHADDACVVAPSGEIDLATAPEFGAALASAAAHNGGRHVVLDLRGVTFIDSSGINIIIKMHRFFGVEGTRFGVVRGGDIVQRAFQVASVDPLIPWTDPPEPDPAPPEQ
jgi:anti-sigma B factor antagonist